MESIRPDAGDAVRYYVIDDYLPYGVSKQNGFFFVEQNTVHIFVIQTARPNNDARKAAAFIEGRRPDAGDTIRNHDALQVGAIPEGIISNGSDSIRNVDARQAGAVLESIRPDAGELTVFPESDARQAGAVKEVS